MKRLRFTEQKSGATRKRRDRNRTTDGRCPLDDMTNKERLSSTRRTRQKYVFTTFDRIKCEGLIAV
jgi:hypothetical protein